MPLPTLPQDDANADDPAAALAAQARAELALLAYPAREWLPATTGPAGEPVLDVVVVGGGQSALGIAAGLRLQGVHRVALLDRAPAGHEGVWLQFARMPELRTPKLLNGLDFGLPALSVQRWYAAQHGQAAWDRLTRLPRTHWMDYLRWYRQTLQLPVENDTEVRDVRPGPAAADGTALIAVDTVHAGHAQTRLARRVVLATGQAGGGAWRLPPHLAEALPAAVCHHSCDEIDFATLRGQRVAILGHGASAFDNAAAALRAGARSVDLCFRRARLPRVNPHRHIETAGLMTHYPRLADEIRWQVARHFRAADQPPPWASFEWVCAQPGFAMHAGCDWLGAQWRDGEVHLATSLGTLAVDRVICATGAVFDMAARAELRRLAPHVQRWRDRYTPPPGEADDHLAAHPYLGEHYEFLPRTAGEDDWVGRVHAFNGASYVSQGPHSTSISGHKHALPRLLRGLTQGLFLDQSPRLVADLRRYDEPDLVLPDDFERTMARPQRFQPTPEVSA